MKKDSDQMNPWDGIGLVFGVVLVVMVAIGVGAFIESTFNYFDKQKQTAKALEDRISALEAKQEADAPKVFGGGQ